jgi:hypothetical protein
MALSLGSLFQPLNDFFLDQFKTDDDSQVVFRFDRFGSVVSDDDFIDDAHPDLGPLPGLAREKFSDLVNRVPIDDPDGLNIVLSTNAVDSTYADRLLLPSLPFIPAGTDEQTKQAMFDNFNVMKAAARAIWDQVELTSLSGMLLDFKPSIATPEDWYDSTKSASWTDHALDISEPASSEGVAPAQKDRQLWRLRVSDEAIRGMLETGAGDPTPDTTVAMADRMIAVRDHRAAPSVTGMMPAVGSVRLADRVSPAVMMAQPVSPFRMSAARAFDLDPAIRIVARPGLDRPGLDRPGLGRPPSEPHDVPPGRIPIERLRIAKSLDVRRRVAVSQVIADQAPTEPVTTNHLTITFQYCLVRIARPWLATGFISPGSWYVPGADKGSLTVTQAGGMPLLPIGFVAVRRLAIKANWSADDLAKASDATDLGPFKVDGGIVNDQLSHPGLQVIGWLLQRLPDLPPFGAAA